MQAQPHPIHILLIEDNPSMLRLLPRLLRSYGHAVTAAASAQAARAAAASDDFDLVISDIELPDGNGWDLMRELNARHPVKALAFSGLSTEEDIRRSRDAGFAAHLVKPLDLNRLEQAIEQVAA